MVSSLLRQSELSPLSEASLSLLENELNEEELSQGDILTTENQPQSKAFIISNGEIGCFRNNPETNDPVQLDTFYKGNISGFFHLFEDDPAYFTLKVTSPTATVWTLTSENFKKLLKNETFFRGWLNLTHKRIRQQSKLIRSFQPSKKDPSNKIKVTFFDSSAWTFEAFAKPDYRKKFDFNFVTERLDETTVTLAVGSKVVCCFVNDTLSGNVLRALHSFGVEMIAMRCAGFDKVSVEHAETYNITVARVPAYSPYAVAEHAIALLLSLNRKIHRAYQRTRDANFDLTGLIGFDMHGKTAGIIGTGKIGRCLIDILLGFGCNILCYDIYPSEELKNKPNVSYVELDELFAKSNFISLHAPATKGTYHMINKEAIEKMKRGVIIINTSRGSLIDTKDVLEGLSSGHIGAVGLDVYEGESPYFFQDNSERMIADEDLRALISLSNVLITGHQAFLTREAIDNIAQTTMNNIDDFLAGKKVSSHPNSIY